MKTVLISKFRKMTDDLLIEALDYHTTKEEQKDWRNWTTLELVCIAIVANERGILN